ncbi:MAG: hypothetical protein R6V49_08470 [Bacteroidales bacterium]
MKRSLHLAGFIFLVSLMFLNSSCDKDFGEQKNPSLYSGSEGVFVINEGSFMAGNGDVTFYDRSTKEATQNLFFSVNNRPPGDLPVYMTKYGNDAWIVVNNSNAIEVVELDSFRVRKTISGLDLPKHIVFFGDKGFVSQLGSTKIAVVDPKQVMVTGTIEGFKSSDKMVIAGGKLFVANWSSYFIDKPNNTVMVSIEVLKEPTLTRMTPDGSFACLGNDGVVGKDVDFGETGSGVERR